MIDMLCCEVTTYWCYTNVIIIITSDSTWC